MGKGFKLNEVLEQMEMVVEGVRTAKAAYKFAEKEDVDMPITNGIYHVLFHDKQPKEVVEQLMNRTKKKKN